ncbi:MAG: cysteine desulfurase [Candidatus Wildermuthbacteria bacterium]|nr:cysteine desulfurase [Candidatus Wildermuthbacteria bacterium]
MKKKIYLDYAASTPLDPKVLKEMMPYLKKEFGNPSSLHSFGQKARAAIEQSREKVARFLNSKPLEVVFTSSATEANNLAIRGIAENAQIKGKPHIITSLIEHESVLAPIQELEQEGKIEATYISSDSEGFVKAEDVVKSLKANTVLVSIMYANSEIGTIQPIAEIGQGIKELKEKNPSLKAVFHTDAVQAAQFLDCNVQKLNADLLTLSSHKVYGPKGAGTLYIKEGVSLNSLILGGGQEQGFRSGTENVAAIVGMGRALEEIQNPRTHIANIRIRQLRDKLIKGALSRIPNSFLTGSKTKRLENNVHLRFQGVEGKDLLLALDEKGIAVSTGSACSEKTQEPSRVLLALGLKLEEAASAIRITLGKYTKAEEVERFLKTLAPLVEKLRRQDV